MFVIHQVINEYKDVGVKVYLAGCKAGVREMLEAAKFYEKIEKDILFISVHDAVLSALERSPDMLREVRNAFCSQVQPALRRRLSKSPRTVPLLNCKHVHSAGQGVKSSPNEISEKLTTPLNFCHSCKTLKETHY